MMLVRGHPLVLGPIRWFVEWTLWPRVYYITMTSRINSYTQETKATTQIHMQEECALELSTLIDSLIAQVWSEVTWSPELKQHNTSIKKTNNNPLPPPLNLPWVISNIFICCANKCPSNTKYNFSWYYNICSWMHNK